MGYEEDCWHPLKEGQVTMNFDGYAKGNPGRLILGGS